MIRNLGFLLLVLVFVLQAFFSTAREDRTDMDPDYLDTGQ
jgi:hypothetical protein